MLMEYMLDVCLVLYRQGIEFGVEKEEIWFGIWFPALKSSSWGGAYPLQHINWFLWSFFGVGVGCGMSMA